MIMPNRKVHIAKGLDASPNTEGGLFFFRTARLRKRRGLRCTIFVVFHVWLRAIYTN